jgi:adenylate cyclase
MIQTVLGPAVVATSGWAVPEVAVVYARARELFATTGVTSQIYPVLIGLCGFYTTRGELRVAEEAARQLVRHAETTGDSVGLVGGHNMTGLVLFYGGDFVGAVPHFEKAAALYDPERHSPNRQFSIDHDPGVSCAAHAALTLLMLGYSDRAAARMRECLALAHSINHPLTVAMACNFAATCYQVRREPEVVQELEDVRLEYSRKHDFDLFLLLGEIYRGWLAAERGRLEEGLAQIQYGVAAFQAIGAELGRPTFLGILADVYDRLGRTDEALATVDDAFALAEQTGLHYWDAELHRMKGDFLLHAGARGDAAESAAEACFREALDIARRQQGKLIELRAAMSASRLLQRQGRTDEARALLAGVYGWFTEGFATPDLVDAKALLDALGARRRM